MSGPPIGSSSAAQVSSASGRRTSCDDRRCGLMMRRTRSRSKLKVDASGNLAPSTDELGTEIILERQARQGYFEQFSVRGHTGALLRGLDQACRNPARHAHILGRTKQPCRAGLIEHQPIAGMRGLLLGFVLLGSDRRHCHLRLLNIISYVFNVMSSL